MHVTYFATVRYVNESLRVWTREQNLANYNSKLSKKNTAKCILITCFLSG